MSGFIAINEFPSKRLVCCYTSSCCSCASLGASGWFNSTVWNGCGVVAYANWFFSCIRCENVFISSREVSSLFMRCCSMLMGSFSNRNVWMNFAALSWKAVYAINFRHFRKSEKVSIVGLYLACSNFHLAIFSYHLWWALADFVHQIV